MTTTLKIPKPKTDNEFKEVSFVNEMNDRQLKGLIRRMWVMLGELANDLDKTIPSVANAIDSIRNNGRWSKKELPKRQSYYNVGDILVQIDTLKGKAYIYKGTTGDSYELNEMSDKEIAKKFPELR
jgi:hypothetical protein